MTSISEKWADQARYDAESMAEFLRELSAYYIQTRYPEEVDLIGEKVTRPFAEENFNRTEGVLRWLSQML